MGRPDDASLAVWYGGHASLVRIGLPRNCYGARRVGRIMASRQEEAGGRRMRGIHEDDEHEEEGEKNDDGDSLKLIATPGKRTTTMCMIELIVSARRAEVPHEGLPRMSAPKSAESKRLTKSSESKSRRRSSPTSVVSLSQSSEERPVGIFSSIRTGSGLGRHEDPAHGTWAAGCGRGAPVAFLSPAGVRRWESAEDGNGRCLGYPPRKRNCRPRGCRWCSCRASRSCRSRRCLRWGWGCCETWCGLAVWRAPWGFAVSWTRTSAAACRKTCPSHGGHCGPRRRPRRCLRWG